MPHATTNKSCPTASQSTRTAHLSSSRATPLRRRCAYARDHNEQCNLPTRHTLLLQPELKRPCFHIFSAITYEYKLNKKKKNEGILFCFFFPHLKFLFFALTVRQRADNQCVPHGGMSLYGGASGNRCARLLCARCLLEICTRVG